ncbi:hypothetical protein HDU98_004481 [Podochytrium sp. JEL0797]|nr:hypothetical protein HDU98_004481 [Podochytrium sp. JEL0797]
MPKVEVTRRHRAHNKSAAAQAAPATTFSFAGISAPGTTQPTSALGSLDDDHAELDSGNGKKEKRVARRDKWLEKMNGVYSARANADKRKKKKEVFGVAADLEDIQQILEAPEMETEQPAKEPVAKPGKKKPVSQKARTKEGINEMLRMQNILTHKAFKSNPLATIRTHLKNTIE